ncbi:43029_t:CDS:1, partial [Gigaspora margarita]
DSEAAKQRILLMMLTNFLKDQTDKQLQILELGVLDKDLLFKDEKFSKMETKELEIKKETLRLTK